MTNRTKQNRKHRDNNNEDDDYVYPTKKVREDKIRERRSSKNLIKAGLIDFENPEHDSFEEEEGEIYDDKAMDEAIMAEYYEDLQEHEELIQEMDEIDQAHAFDSLHDDLMEDCGYDWEDY